VRPKSQLRQQQSRDCNEQFQIIVAIAKEQKNNRNQQQFFVLRQKSADRG